MILDISLDGWMNEWTDWWNMVSLGGNVECDKYMMELLSELLDSSFKYILLGMNLLTIVVVYFLQKGRIFNK